MTLHGARRFLSIALAFSLAVLFVAAASTQPQDADAGSGRVALVIGNAAYPARRLATSVNDAGLVAEMVRNAGYDLVEARDADETLLRQTVRDFLDKVAAAGPDAVAFVYLSGYGLQFEGDNYFVPVSARLARVSDLPTEAFRVGDLLRALAGMNVAARVVVLDMARAHPFFGGARAVPPGLTVVEPGEGTLVAFSTGPGAVLRDGAGPYGLYAPALVEMATKPGVPLDQLFTQVRLRVHEASRGAITPWHRSRISAPVFFFEDEATPDDTVPPQAELNPQAQQLLGRPLASLSPDQAYGVALERDSIEAYQEFLAAFPGHPLAKRVRLLLAERREALIWRRAVAANTPPAYWSYLRRYPRGPHAPEARRRLAALIAPVEPPSDFAMMDYGVPPPTDDEVAFYEDYYGTYYGGEPPDYAPPPPFPVYLLPPLEPAFVDLPPPVYYEGAAYLPVPGAIMMRR
ncbi:MAG TPA: caspase family protein, partial [Xanthobacteraceae bacterium]|nr:caspase family protein [Xanthobacteraceae bacterium]